MADRTTADRTADRRTDVRVLLIEDERRLAEQVRRGLSAEGFAVDVVHNGTEGFVAALHGPADVIVCDIMLPGLSGYEIVRRLRGEQVWTPVLMLTAKDGEHDEADAFDLGADDYLTKPFSLVVLVARLRSLLRRAAPERSIELAAGDLRLDPGARRAWRGAVELSLTPREFAVLEFLLRRAGQVVSKQAVLDAVWDAQFDADPNVVEVYIGYLRRKVDAPFGRRSIVTVRGMGYRVEDGEASGEGPGGMSAGD